MRSEPKVEYVVRCQDGYERSEHTSEVAARTSAAEYDSPEGHHIDLKCRPHRVIKRTITEEDITDAD